MEAIKKHLKNLVASEAINLLVVIKEIKELIRYDTNYFDDIIILEGTIKDTLRDNFLSLHSKYDIDISMARTREAIISIINKIEKGDIKAQSTEKEWWDGVPYEWEKAFEYLIGLKPDEKAIRFLFKVQELSVKSEYITDLQLISNFKQIEKLTLDLPNVEDYSYIKHLPSIKTIIINTGKNQLNLTDIISKNYIEQFWLNSYCKGRLDNIVLPNIAHVGDLRITNYDLSSLHFLHKFNKIDYLTIEKCEIDEINFLLLDEKKIINLQIDLNFDKEQTVWLNNLSTSIKSLKVICNKRLENLNLSNLFTSLPNLEVIKIKIENIDDYYYSNLELDYELPIFLAEAIESNALVIDFSETILYSDNLFLRLLKYKANKKIVLNKYDFVKVSILKNKYAITPTIDFELNETISF